MAGIDHTRLVFKNGKLLTDDEIGYYDEENDTWVNLLPFRYGRDGDIYEIGNVDISGQIKWYKDEFDAVYQRCGLDKYGARLFKTTRKFSFWYIKQRLKWLFHCMEKVCYRKEIGALGFEDGSNLYIHHDSINQSYASFYVTKTDAYVVLGGYGHWKNVYTHFMHRGYGEEFEEKMASEAYHWLWNEVLKDICESVAVGMGVHLDWEEYESVVNETVEPYAKYDTYGKEY